MSNIRSIKGVFPNIHPTSYIDSTAVVIGQVEVGENSSLWCNVVARGDVNSIKIGKNSNIQDLTMLHVTHHNPPVSHGVGLSIGDNVTIGHNCCLHACSIGNNVLVGMGSTVLDNAVIDDNVLVGAGSVVPPNRYLESGWLYLGNPLKQVRQLKPDEIDYLQYSAEHYVNIAKLNKEG